MFETAEVGHALPADEYDALVPELRTALLRAQNELARDAKFSVVVVIAGVDGAGKGETVNTLHDWMDPRYLLAHAFGPPSDEEAERPPMWRFWRDLPPKGRVGIFFGSWYTAPILQRAYGESRDADLDAALERINGFEKALVDDGTLVLKYWFHISKKAQRRRLKELSRDPKQAWRVGPVDWRHYELFDTFLPVCERALRETSTGEAPWTIVEGVDRRYREVTVAQHLLASVRRHLERSRLPAAAPPSPIVAPPVARKTVLDTVDLAATLSREEYRSRMDEGQARLAALSRSAQERGATLLAVFEGPDAAGKGGAIRRVTRALDARTYRVIPIAAPTDEERARHYLWRFWRHLPRAGHVVIFDRSWYGRVLVERVEGFAAPHEWMRAYKEINELEERLFEFGIGVCKFWLHIDKDEQLRRFQEREHTSYKEFKITEEDYRNRAKWEPYEDAVHDMVERTSTAHAPWTLVAANDKLHARVQVVETLCDTLEAELRARRKRRKRDV